jgi:hypothetical protein
MEAWPADRTTIQVPDSLEDGQTAQLLNRLPPGQWWSWVKEDTILWVRGTLPPELTPVEGMPLQPDLIAGGHPAALAERSSDWKTGGIGSRNDTGFRVMGKTELPEGAELLLPAALRFQTEPTPDHLEVMMSGSMLTPFLRDLDFFPDLRLLDHQQKRQQARAGFRRLTLRLLALGLTATVLTALILQTLIRLELKERRFEFALRRSLGATPANIRHQILAEILVLIGVPSLLGVIMIPPTSMAAGIILGLLLPGWLLLCALPPANHAASLPPHDALKEG